MQLTVLKTGGVAGMRQQLGPVDTDHVSGAVSSAIARMVEEVGFFNLPERLEPSNMPDDFHLVIDIVDGARDHQVAFDEHSPSPEARSLLELVAALQQGGFDFEDEDQPPGEETEA